MKNFAKLFVVAIVLSLVASLFAVSAFAAESPAGDPRGLTPGSDKVYFIMDAPEGGELPGDGTGRDAQNPYKPRQHEKFVDNGPKSQFDLNTAFYQVTEELKATGGTIVICGPVHFTADQSYGDSASMEDVRTARFGKNTIKFTSVYNGVDYRETNGACITVTQPAMLSISGQSIWENIRIGAGGTERAISFENNLTLIGEGVECFPLDELFEGQYPYYISLAAGTRYSKGTGVTPTMVVQSGTYNKIVGAMWGAATTHFLEDTITYLTIEGSTTVLGSVIGSTGRVSEFGGNVNVTINGGTFPCEIMGVGPTGMTNTDGIATLKITGGNFKPDADKNPDGVYSIAPISAMAKNNAPAFSAVDFSGWTGDMENLAFAYNKAAEAGFTKIMLPKDVTEEDLAAKVETTAPVVEQTDAPDNNDDNAPSKDDKDDKKPGAAVGVGEGEGNNLVIIIIAVAAVVVIAAAVVVVVVLKKKKSSK